MKDLIEVMAFLSVAIPILWIIFDMRSTLRDVERAVGENRDAISNLTIKEVPKNEIFQIVKEFGALSPSGLSPLLLAKQESYLLERFFTNRTQKHAIAKWIADNLIKENDILLLDSGSTTDLIPCFVSVSNVTIYTNNVLALINAFGHGKVKTFQLPGLLNHHYAATYSENALNVIGCVAFKKIVLAARSISFEDGPRILHTDDKNKGFKSYCMNLILKPEKYIFAVDWTKFRTSQSLEIGVLDQDKWKQFLKDNTQKIEIVTVNPSNDALIEQQVFFKQAIQKFEDFGIKVRKVDDMSLRPSQHQT